MEKKILYHIGLYGFRKLIVYVIKDNGDINESLWKRINKPKEVIAETNRLRKVRSMLLDWILIWLILSESNQT